ncbi:hypothetical protein DEO72_LG1g2729 [Vigna unguiculata]|uniref:Uncharacterized protein n=1 Tax=Vigna unguiculata TaxID=3917 RepID=A0A4D6KX49_VIGUN|nr:hypothetical protein DEO72_LG1g2729 [Vigna unguiculata]
MVVVTDTGAGNGSVFALADAMEVLVAVVDLHSVEDRSNLARVRLQVQTVLLLLRNAGCCCDAETRGHGAAAERDAVASMEVGRGYGSLQVARWLTANICRSGSLRGRWWWLLRFVGDALRNTMASVHLEPRHKRNFMASGNDRGQKGCL